MRAVVSLPKASHLRLNRQIHFGSRIFSPQKLRNPHEEDSWISSDSSFRFRLIKQENTGGSFSFAGTPSQRNKAEGVKTQQAGALHLFPDNERENHEQVS